MTQIDPLELHDRHARQITKAMAGLLTRFGAAGLTPEAVCEGAIKGAGVVMISAGLQPSEFAALLHDLAREFETLDTNLAPADKSSAH